MRLGRLFLLSSIFLGSTAPAIAAIHAHRGPTSPRIVRSKRIAAKSKAIVGQRTIDDERATQIQAALIRAGYLTGTPSGHWDDETQAAMERIQAENGWQTKLVPDSRAIIKLGLGSSTLSPAPQTSLTPAHALNQTVSRADNQSSIFSRQ
jgi:peptidoglycan hydrolase-like protein with peptidoglycan-binding domain